MINLMLDIAFLMLLEVGLLNNSIILAEIGLCTLGLEAFRVWTQATISQSLRHFIVSLIANLQSPESFVLF